MCGSATLAMVVSSACMNVAAISDAVSKPRLPASGALAARTGVVVVLASAIAA